MRPPRTYSGSHAVIQLALACLFLLAHPGAGADSTLAVLDFELNDLTPLPGGLEERERTASIRLLLETAIRETSPEIKLIAIDPAAAQNADAAFGYLFEHSAEAARLGADHGADWILVGRLTKPSFLFAYLMARLVDTRTGKIAEDIVIEIKGQQQIVTGKGVTRLAQKLKPRLDHGPLPIPRAPGIQFGD